jgi:hypothetical protein
MRVAIGTAVLLVGLALYALLGMQLAVTALPENLVVRTLYYLAAGLLWVWPAARLTRWIQARR